MKLIRARLAEEPRPEIIINAEYIQAMLPLDSDTWENSTGTRIMMHGAFDSEDIPDLVLSFDVIDGIDTIIEQINA